MQTLVLLAIINFRSASANFSTRVVGGSETIIAKYPSSAVILDGNRLNMIQKCGGAIVNEKFILTAAHCFRWNDSVANFSDYRVRVGSTTARAGGVLHEIKAVIAHPKWNKTTHDSDIALMRTVNDIIYSYTTQPAILAHTDYHLRDSEPLWAVGWGFITERGPASEILRHVLVLSINQEICQAHYRGGFKITDNMMCSGWLSGVAFGGDQCTYDSGSPIYHNGTVVGIASIGVGCGNPNYPAINVRISRFTKWIQDVTGTKNISPLPKVILNWKVVLSLQTK